jgi:hypothetical protein
MYATKTQKQEETQIKRGEILCFRAFVAEN